jgi:hypothetical protein
MSMTPGETTFWQFQHELQRERHGSYVLPVRPMDRWDIRRQVKSELRRLEKHEEMTRAEQRRAEAQRRIDAEILRKHEERAANLAAALKALASRELMGSRIAAGHVHWLSSVETPRDEDTLARERIALWNALVWQQALPTKLDGELEGLKFMVMNGLWSKEQECQTS